MTGIANLQDSLYHLWICSSIALLILLILNVVEVEVMVVVVVDILLRTSDLVIRKPVSTVQHTCVVEVVEGL